jgi:hypothetical protein
MFRTVQLLSPFTPGWFFVFNLIRPNNTTEEAFVEFAKSEVPDAKYLVGHDDTIYCFVPANISLEEIKAILDNQDVLPGTAKLFYLASMSNFSDMLRVLDKSAAKSKGRANAGKCDCGLCGDLEGEVSDVVKELVKSIRISAIPYNDQTRAVVRKFFDATIASKKAPTIEDMRELRAGLVAVIGEEAANAAGMTPTPEDAVKAPEA